MAINTNYNDYSGSLFNYNTANVNASSGSMYDILMAEQNFNASKASYGKNNANSVDGATSKYMTDVKAQSGNIKSALDKLVGRGKEVSSFDERTPVSSDKDAMAIKSYQSSKNSDLSDATVRIDQVATTQKNQGDGMEATGRSFSQGEYYQFEVSVGGKTHQISFTTSFGEDNWDVQQKMAEAINKKDIGVTASISYDSKTKTSSLTVESNTTGKQAGAKEVFSVKDVRGDAVAQTGIGSITQEASNAMYSINNGAVKSSQSNDVDLGNGVVATLKQANSNNITVEMKNDSTSAINKVREMVNGFNGLLAAAEENDTDRGSKRLFNELTNLAVNYGASLQRIGIKLNDNGYMEIDKDKMQKAYETGDLEKFFRSDGENSNYGFANRLARTAEKANKNPTEYVSVTAANSLKESSSHNYNNNSSTNYLYNARFNQILNTGMLLDMMF